MGVTASIVKKEIKSYFTSPIAYVVIAVFSVMNGFVFFNYLSEFNMKVLQFLQIKIKYPELSAELSINDWVLTPLFSNLSMMLLLLMPTVSMRLIAEEKRSGTFEFLMTSPVTTLQIMLGKFFSCLFFYTVMLLTTIQYPLILFSFGNPDLKPVLISYLMLFLLGAAFIAVGMAASSLTENQIIAAITSFGVLLIFWLVGWLGENIGGKAGEVISFFSLFIHLGDSLQGVLDTRDVVFYLSFIFFGLYVTYEALDSERWR